MQRIAKLFLCYFSPREDSLKALVFVSFKTQGEANETI